MEVQHHNLGSLDTENQASPQEFDNLYQNSRLSFIRKVYSIVAMQLLMVTIFCVIAAQYPQFLNFQLQNWWLMILSIIMIITIEITIFCCSAGKKYPLNMVLLTIFTLCDAYFVSFICSMVLAQHDQNGKYIILQAAAMTLFIVIGLTVYALTTKSDFTTARGIMVVLIMALISFGFICYLSVSSILYNIYCIFGVIVFGIYLVIDTQMIVGGKKHNISMDDYVIAAMLLYIDIIEIFIRLLILLSRLQRDN